MCPGTHSIGAHSVPRVGPFGKNLGDKLNTFFNEGTQKCDRCYSLVNKEGSREVDKVEVNF